jgi:bifunctional non-homologous end joining protein LigD
MVRKPVGRASEVFTVEVPKPLRTQFDGTHWWTDVGGRRLRLSNLNKIFWPERGYTKGDLLAYYHNIGPRILRYLRDRPLTLRRMPDGTNGPHFFEKDAPAYTPDWMPRCHVPHFETEFWGGRRKAGPKDFNDFLMANDEAGLLYIANLGCIEMHPLHARCSSLDKPDYLFFDLDPAEGASFEDVVIVAGYVRAALGALDLPSYPKTSGMTGVQVYVPIARGPSFDETREFVKRVGQHIVRSDPGRATMTWTVADRAGKVFIDHNMNRRGQNIASAYSLRPSPEATVSMPLRWEELEAGARPEDFTVVNVHETLHRRRDPFLPVMTKSVDLVPALEAIGALDRSA